MLQVWQIRIAKDQQGPRGGKRDPLLRWYGVTAETAEEARALFEAEMGPLEADTRITITECRCRVMAMAIRH